MPVTANISTQNELQDLPFLEASTGSIDRSQYRAKQ